VSYKPHNLGEDMAQYFGKKTYDLVYEYETGEPEMNIASFEDYIHEIALAEAILLINKVENTRLYTVDDICEIFDYKYQFVRKNILKNKQFNRVEINPHVKRVITQLKNMPIGEIIEVDEMAVAELCIKPLKITIRKNIKDICDLLTRKKAFIFEHHLIEFIQYCFFISVNGDKMSLSYEGVKDMINCRWKSGKTIKEEFDIVHDEQLYRMLRKEGQYFKLIYKHCESNGKYVTRYLKND